MDDNKRTVKRCMHFEEYTRVCASLFPVPKIVSSVYENF